MVFRGETAESVSGEASAFVDGDEAKRVDRSVFAFETAEDYENVIVNVAKAKAENGEFVNVFEPYYMRKSQAEREKGL